MPALASALRSVALAAAVALPLAAQATPNFANCRLTQAVHYPGTIVDAAIATPALSTLTSLVVAANLVGPLSQPGHLTVYAPTNEAFAKIPPAVLNAIGGDLGLLTQVLTYHVVPGRGDPRTAYKREVDTLQGQTLFIGFDRDDGASVNQSVANCQAVRTTNGTVWLIDSVLLPQFR